MKKLNSKTIDIYKKIGKRYLKETEKIYPSDIDEFISLIPKKSLVLDVGCAGGRDSKIFFKNNISPVGIDAVPLFIKEAKKKVPKGKFYIMDLLKLDFPENSFDAIWAQAILLHFNKKEVSIILKKFYNVLKVNGLLHVRLRETGTRSYRKDKVGIDDERQFYYYKQSDIVEILKKLKFKIIKNEKVKDEQERKGVNWFTIWAKK